MDLLTWKGMCIRHGFAPETDNGIILLSYRLVRRGSVILKVGYHVDTDGYMVYVSSPTEKYKVPLPSDDAEFLAMII